MCNYADLGIAHRKIPSLLASTDTKPILTAYMTHDAQASIRDGCDGMRLAHQPVSQGTAPLSSRWTSILNTPPNSRFFHPSLRPATGLAAPDTSFVFRMEVPPHLHVTPNLDVEPGIPGRETLIYKTSLLSYTLPFINLPSSQ